MNRDDILLLLAYNYWATDRVVAAAQRASEDERHRSTSSSGQSIHSTLVHLMDAERIWRQRCQKGPDPTTLSVPSDYPTIDDLLQKWGAERQSMRAFLDGLSDADLSGVVRYQNTQGVPYEQALWQILVHVINHGTQHRAEVAYLLTELGYSPGDIDFMLYLRQRTQTDGEQT